MTTVAVVSLAVVVVLAVVVGVFVCNGIEGVLKQQQVCNSNRTEQRKLVKV